MKQLRVALDARPLNTDHLRGMGRYAREIVERLGPEKNVEWRLFGDMPRLPLQLTEPEKWPAYQYALPGARLHAWEQFLLPAGAFLTRADVLHCIATSAPLWQPIPTVVTIHDAIPWIENDRPAGRYRDFVLPRAYQRAKAIITISEHSRRDILALWPALESKLHLIYHGVASDFLRVSRKTDDMALAALGIFSPYVLYLGGDLPRKRFEWALDLWKALDDPSISLVVAGFPSSAHERFVSAIAPERARSIVFLPFVADAQMPRLYQNALAVIYPSLYEGFGFPALEAQSTGTPLLVGDVSSLRELAAPATPLLPPHDFGAWLAALRRTVRERLEHPEPIDELRHWASRFSWQRSADRHFEVYQSVARKRIP